MNARPEALASSTSRPGEGGDSALEALRAASELRTTALQLLRQAGDQPHRAKELFDLAAKLAGWAARLQGRRSGPPPAAPRPVRPVEKDAAYYLARASYCFRMARKCDDDGLAATFRELGAEFADAAARFGDPRAGGV